nr:uncharacterized protein CI109_001701 [Kwoniella shandongensis]KAA5529762.1 hypothetical protein CI109_001701 [Kwoniella shandongensis]
MSSAASSDLPTREEFAPQVVKILKGNLGSLVEKVFAGEVTLFDPDVEWVDANDDQQGDIVLSVVLSPSDESLQLMREKERIGIWTGRQNQLSSLGTIIQRHSDDTERVYDTLFPTTFEADKAKTKIQQASSSLLPTDFVEERTKLKEAHDRIDPNAYPAVSEYIDKTLERIDAMEELQQANLSDLISIYGSRQGAEEEAKAFKVNRK